tara:strand:+ start:71123 stop:74212 length:3090 start_codon:yes stop_codon:yes gene_type:complete
MTDLPWVKLSCGVVVGVMALADGFASAQLLAQPKTPSEHQTTNSFWWNVPVDGEWFEEANWANTITGSLAGYPWRLSDHAGLGGSEAYAVEVDRLLRIGSVSILNPQAELRLHGGVNWYMHGDLVNEGTIRMNDNGVQANSILRAGEPFRIDGQGVIELNSQTSPYDAQLLSLDHQITIGPEQTIHGSGAVRGNIRNEGLILADVPSEHGMVLGFDFVQSETGRIIIEQNTLRLEPATTLTGGHLGMGDGSTLEISGGTRVNVDSISFGNDTALFIDGDVEFPMPESTPSLLSLSRNYTVFTLEGDYINDDQIVVGGGDGPAWATLRIGADCVVSGDGEIVMVPGINELIVEDQHTMTIRPGQSIVGGGEISTPNGGQIVNQSAIISTDDMKCRAKVVGGQLIADGSILFLDYAEIYNAELVYEQGGSIRFDRTRLVDVIWNQDLVSSGRLYLGGACTNNGILTLMSSTVFCDPDSVLLGEGSIRLNGGGIIEGSLTLPSTQTISGWGTITTAITSDSQIWVDEGRELIIGGGPHIGGDYIADGGAIRISGEFSDSRFIVGDGQLTLWNAELNNCTIMNDLETPLRLIAGGDLVLNNMRYDGNLDIRANVNQTNESEVYLRGNTEINGNHYIFDEGTLVFDSADLSGDSVFTMAWSTQDLRPRVYAMDGSGLSGGYLLQGSGEVVGEDGGLGFVNRGQLIANNPLAPMRLSGTFSGDGIYLVEDSEVEFYNGAILKGVTLDANGTGFYSLSGLDVDFEGVTNRGTIVVNRSNAALTVSEAFINEGMVSLQPEEGIGFGTLIMNEAEILGSGTIELSSVDDGFDSRVITLGDSVIGPDQLIRGDGFMRGQGPFEFRGRFNLRGTLDPAGSSRTLGLDDLVMEPEARVILDIEGTDEGQFDAIEVISQGRITLGGTLDVRFGESFSPSFGDVWAIVSGGAFIGAFEEIVTYEPLPSGLVLQTIDLDGELMLAVTCGGDYNADFIVDFFDISNFLADFNTQAPAADINGDGIFDFFDVSAILDLVSAGCGPD